MKLQTVEIHPTVEQLAEWFCELGSDEMAEFFTHCRHLSEAWKSGMGIYHQALYMKDEMPVGSDGARFLMDLAAPFYLHTLRFIEQESS